MRARVLITFSQKCSSVCSVTDQFLLLGDHVCLKRSKSRLVGDGARCLCYLLGRWDAKEGEDRYRAHPQAILGMTI